MLAMQKSGEDYLEAILRISEETGSEKVRTTDIANKLGVSKPSVSRAMGVLRDDGYIEQESYGDIVLTDDGRTIAEGVFDSHKLLTAFLYEIIGVSLDTAEHDACLIEHDISAETKKRLSEYYKKVCGKKA